MRELVHIMYSVKWTVVCRIVCCCCCCSCPHSARQPSTHTRRSPYWLNPRYRPLVCLFYCLPGSVLVVLIFLNFFVFLLTFLPNLLSYLLCLHAYLPAFSLSPYPAIICHNDYTPFPSLFTHTSLCACLPTCMSACPSAWLIIELCCTLVPAYGNYYAILSSTHNIPAFTTCLINYHLPT